MRMLCLFVLAGTLGSIPAAPVVAQANARADSVQHRNSCRLAQQVLLHGHPANKRAWALGYIRVCGAAGGATLASILARDIAVNEDAVMVTSVLHDAAIFRVAFGIANDRTAAKNARIQALRVLFYQFGRGHVDPYESFLASDDGIYMALPDYGCTVGEPLPPDAEGRALEMAMRIISSETDADIRAAARKVAGAAQADRIGC
jgi:hypothetical protein